MTYGTPTWLDEVLTLTCSQLVSVCKLPASDVFESLADDAEHARFPPAKTFIVLRPLSLPVAAGVGGGGRLNTGVDFSFRVSVFQEFASDQELRDTRLLRERSRSIMGMTLKVVNSLQMFSPLRSAGVCVLKEPMRMRGLDIAPRRIKETNWAVVASTWEASFVVTMPATTP